jgi:uncharacterized membrane protein
VEKFVTGVITLIIVAVIVVVLFCLFSWLFMSGWNGFAVEALNAKAVTFVQAEYAILLLASIGAGLKGFSYSNSDKKS